jgi:hypothetical protein
MDLVHGLSDGRYFCLGDNLAVSVQRGGSSGFVLVAVTLHVPEKLAVLALDVFVLGMGCCSILEGGPMGPDSIDGLLFFGSEHGGSHNDGFSRLVLILDHFKTQGSFICGLEDAMGSFHNFFA